MASTGGETGGDIPSMFAAADRSFEFKSKRFREAHAENPEPENWFLVQKRIAVSNNLLKSLWMEMEDAVTAGELVTSIKIDEEATKIRDDMLARVRRAESRAVRQ
jgi:hypothetical protein